MDKLDKKAIWLFFFQYLRIGAFFAFLVFALTYNILSDLSGRQAGPATILYPLIIFTFLWMAFSYFIAWLAHRFYRYELTEEAYKAERGIIWKRYISIPYSRIQNVDIYRGILDRLLGLSDIQIHTAGYGGVGGANRGSEGRLPGLDRQKAEELRDELIKKAKNNSQQGF